MLTAMSILAFLGLRYPVKMLPVLLFESAWKLLWLALVAVPRATGPGLHTATTQVPGHLTRTLGEPRAEARGDTPGETRRFSRRDATPPGDNLVTPPKESP